MDATLTLWQRIVRVHPSAAQSACSGGFSAVRYLLAALLALCLTGSALAQAATGTVYGRVLNVGNNRYLEKAMVTVEGTNISTLTDQTGGYRLTLPAGPAKLNVSYTGLDAATITVDVIAGEFTMQDVELTSAARYGEDKTLVLDTFVIESQREYEGDALATNEQRHAPNVKVVMSSDSFGTINEGNPGEFLKYLPGITVDYVAADVRTVSVRGFASQFTNVYWDGMRMTSSASGNSGRVFEFEQVSINNTSRSEVSKVPTPDMPADSLGGTINFVSKNAFERKGAQLNYRFYMNGNNENLDFKKTPGPESGDSFKILPNFDFDYTLPLNDRFGIVITGLSSNQYVEQHRWQPTWNYAQAGATASNPYLQQWQLQDGPKTTNRASLGVKADWKVTDNQVLSVAFQNNYYKTFFGNRNLNFNIGTTATPSTTGRNSLQWGPSFVTSAFGRASVTQGSSFRDKLGNTFAAKVDHELRVGDWKVESGLSYAKSRSWYRALGRGHFANVGTTMQNVSTVSAFNIQDDSLVWVARDTNGATLNPNVLSNYRLGNLTDDPVDGFATMLQGRVDVERQLDVGFPLSVKAGGSMWEETRDNRRSGNQYTFVGADGTANTADDSAAPFVDTAYFNQDPFWGYQPIQWINPYLLAQAREDNPAWFRYNDVTSETNRINGSERISEKVTAGYIQFEGQLLQNKLGFVAGVRYEKTEDQGKGLLVNADNVWQRNANGSFVDGDLVTAGVQRVRRVDAGAVGSLQELYLVRQERAFESDRSYDGFYPSVHLTYNISNDFLIRFAYAKTFGRPDYANIIPNTTVNEDDTDPINNPGTISVRNTALRPWTGQNYDLSLEYYFKEGGLITGGVFKKDLSDFWGSRGGTVDAALANELGLDSRYVGWGVTTTVNVGDATIEGAEFNLIRPLTFLPGWGKFFTVKLNGTKLRLGGPNAPDFRGFIEETGNFNIGFNKKPFSANLTFNYRGRQKNAPQTGAQYGATAGFYEYYAPRTFVDVSGEVKLTKNMALFAGVRNLFNKQQVLQRYNDVSPTYSKSFRHEEFGIAMSVGIKGSF
ncbi:TonB-dependent receptor [Oleiharenicola lentus]|uniref:TonB-dependent receptor n=1 Tax=Oleiharenicola lentus TaxID=2508720 RepID=A0A4Q1C7P8_9BACT|nr:TonB-dependent receptor [Oleiharenicola lentus]RXK54850.1 TonB-dependent receptor [Oleiharenicola lentus]